MINLQFTPNGTYNGYTQWDATDGVDTYSIVWNLEGYWEMLGWSVGDLRSYSSPITLPLEGWRLYNTTTTGVFSVVEGSCVSPTITPTPTPTLTPTPFSCGDEETLFNPILTENDEYISVGLCEYLMFVYNEPTPTPTPTNPCVEFLTDESGNIITDEMGNPIISETNPCITPTPTQSVTPTLTQTITPTPTQSVTPTITPTLTQTITPTPTQEPLYPLTLYIQPLSGGQFIIFDGITYSEETTVNIALNTFYEIEAIPIPGYMFVGWNIFGGSFSSTGQTTTVSISLTSGANLAPSYSVDPNYDALENQMTTNLINYQNATVNDWVVITQEEYNNIVNNVPGIVKIGNNDTQINNRDVATGWDTTTFGTIDADTPLTIPTGYYVVGFVAESWNQNGQVQLGYTTTYHTGAPTYMSNSPNVIGGTTMFYVRKRPSGVEAAPASVDLFPVLNFIPPAYPNAVLNTFGWKTTDGGISWSQTNSVNETAKIQLLITNVDSWP